MSRFKITVTEIAESTAALPGVTVADSGERLLFQQTMDAADFTLSRFVRDLNKSPRRRSKKEKA